MRPNRPLLIGGLLVASVLLSLADTCDILVPPQNVTTQECRRATFTVIANASPAPGFTWLKNGSVVASNAGPSYTTPILSLSDNGATYQVIVNAGVCISTSAPATLNVVADTQPPVIVSASAVCASNVVVVVFDELVNPVTASEPANYVINGLGVFGAALDADGRTVRLSVGTLSANTNYTLTVDNVSDLCAGNPIAPGAQVVFQCASPPQILAGPQDFTTVPGSNAFFSVSASGPPPLRFVWYKDGNRIPGAVGSALVLSNVQAADVARYAVAVSNGGGVVLSAPGRLKLQTGYQLTLPPGYSLIANQLHRGSNTVAEVLPSVAEGTFLLKWRPALQAFEDANTFFDAFGWSDPGMTLAPGEGAFIWLPAAGPTVLDFSGEMIPPTFPLPVLAGFNLLSRQIPQPGLYREIVGLDPVEGAIVDQFVTVDVDYRTRTYVAGQWRDAVPQARVGEAVWVSRVILPGISIQPQPQTNAPIGTNVVFSVGVTGAPPFRFQWRRNGVSIPGATNASLLFTNAQLTDAGLYTVAVQSSRQAPSNVVIGGKIEDVIGAVVSQPAELKFNTVNFPFSDSFAGQPLLPGQPALLLTGNNSAATREAGETNHAGKIGGHSVWVAWTPPTNGIAIVRTHGSAFDTLLAVYRGSGFGVEVVSDDDAGPSLTSEVGFNAQFGEVYYIAIDGFAGARGNFVFGLNFFPAPNAFPTILGQPQNLLVDLNTPITFSVNAAGPSLTYEWLFDGVPIPNSSTSNSFFLGSVRDTDAGVYAVRISTPTRSLLSKPALLQMRPSGPPPLKSLPGAAPDVEIGGDLFAMDKFVELATAATNLALAPRDRRPAKAVAHGFSGTQIFSTVASTKEVGEPDHAGVRGGKSEWFAYQPTNHGSLRIDTDGSNFDTVLAVYVGPGDSMLTLTNVASDNNSGSNGLTSKVVFNVTSNTIYWIAVDGVNHPVTGVAASGSVHLNYRLALPLVMTNVAFSATNNGRVVLKVSGTPNLAAVLETATNLAAPAWTPLFTNATTSGSFLYTNTNSFTFTNRFIRALNNL